MELEGRTSCSSAEVSSGQPQESGELVEEPKPMELEGKTDCSSAEVSSGQPQESGGLAEEPKPMELEGKTSCSSHLPSPSKLPPTEKQQLDTLNYLIREMTLGIKNGTFKMKDFKYFDRKDVNKAYSIVLKNVRHPEKQTANISDSEVTRESDLDYLIRQMTLRMQNGNFKIKDFEQHFYREDVDKAHLIALKIIPYPEKRTADFSDPEVIFVGTKCGNDATSVITVSSKESAGGSSDEPLESGRVVAIEDTVAVHNDSGLSEESNQDVDSESVDSDVIYVKTVPGKPDRNNIEPQDVITEGSSDEPQESGQVVEVEDTVPVHNDSGLSEESNQDVPVASHNTEELSSVSGCIQLDPACENLDLFQGDIFDEELEFVQLLLNNSEEDSFSFDDIGMKDLEDGESPCMNSDDDYVLNDSTDGECMNSQDADDVGMKDLEDGESPYMNSDDDVLNDSTDGEGMNSQDVDIDDSEDEEVGSDDDYVLNNSTDEESTTSEDVNMNSDHFDMNDLKNEEDCIYSNRRKKRKCNDYHVGNESYPDCVVDVSKNNSLSLFTKQNISAGEIIAPLFGCAVPVDSLTKIQKRYPSATFECLSPKYALVSTDKSGSVASFAQHRCNGSNSELRRICLPNGDKALALFALRDIKAGEEITRDKAFNFSPKLFVPGPDIKSQKKECNCGAVNCSKLVDDQVKYDGRNVLGMELVQDVKTPMLSHNEANEWPSLFPRRDDEEMHPFIVARGKKCQMCNKLKRLGIQMRPTGIFRCLCCNLHLCHDCHFKYWHRNLADDYVTVKLSNGVTLNMKSPGDRETLLNMTPFDHPNQVPGEIMNSRRLEKRLHARVFSSGITPRRPCLICEGKKSVARCVQCRVNLCNQCWFKWHININPICTIKAKTVEHSIVR